MSSISGSQRSSVAKPRQSIALTGMGRERRISVAGSTSSRQSFVSGKKHSGQKLSVSSSKRGTHQDHPDLSKQSQITVFDEFGNNVTPVSLLSLKPSVLKVQQINVLATPGSSTPTSEHSESFERISSAGFSRSGFSISSSGATTPEPPHADKADSIYDEASRPTSPKGEDSDAAKEERRRGQHANQPEELEEEKVLTEQELDEEVVIKLEETSTIWLLQIPGVCVAMDSPFAQEVTEKNQKYTTMKKARGGSDLYQPRGAQTLPKMLKTKEMQATPPVLREQAVSAAVWDIYDTYKSREEPDSPNDVGGPKQPEEKTAPKDGDDESEATENSDAAADGSRSNLLESENIKTSLKVVERMCIQNAYHDKHLLYRNYLTYTDALSWAPSEDKQSDVGMEPLWSFTCGLVAGRNVSSMAWNRMKEDLLAVGYGQFDFSGQKDGYICFWSMKNPEWPERVYPVPVGVCSVAFSTAHPNLLAAGLYDGTVAIYDVRKPDTKPVLESNHTNGKHSDAVWGVRWVDKGSERGESLVSISMDGRVTQWSMKKGLENTDLMKLKRVTNQTKGGNQGNKNEAYISRRASGICLDFSPKDQNIYVAGTEDGNMHKCSCSYAEQYLEHYYGHNGPVYKIRFSPFYHQAFVSCSADWSVKLWSEDHATPILSFQSCQDYVSDICWSPSNGTVFASVTGDGRVEIWDLSSSTLDPIVMRHLEGRKLSSVLFAPTSPVVVTGDDAGSVDVYKVRGLEPEDPSEESQKQRLQHIMFPQLSSQSSGLS